ncbi:hypothetical protein GN958_ATG09163 [Phytophthora infestans]|uniref:Tetratricopeptide repeat protein n=1 Tax=Phytophthora infestans TaxID=4787 RepID=A0A8S9UQ11_PHYIN|nr:hypothetical protein GN958_ATG09163 [Phytophthora infestans]
MGDATEEYVSNDARSAMNGGVYIEWSGDQRVFQMVSEKLMSQQFPAGRLRSALQQERDDSNLADQEYEEIAGHFKGCLDYHDLESAILEMQAHRTRILTKILSSQTPLKWFPSFLLLWQDLLSFIGKRDDIQFLSKGLSEYCRELTALASGWKLVGDVTQARLTLGKCCEVTRRHLKVPFAKTAPAENVDSQALRFAARIAKKLLLNCVAFQTSLARTRELFGRHEAPARVLSSLSKDLWTLFREAPFSIELAILLTQTLMKQRRFAMVTRFLEGSPFSGEDDELTLMHARALAFEGYYREAIRITGTFPSKESKQSVVSTNALLTYCDQLKNLLVYREKADEWLRLEQYEKAESAYEECLALVDPADRRQIATLLFGHANALMGQEKLSAAIEDLKKSLQQDPSNKVAYVRLQTACLQLQTARIKKEISGNNKPRRMVYD